MRQDSSITEIKGIGEKTKKLFEKMGVYTVGDILLHFPRNYIQYPHPVPIDEMTAEYMQTEDKLAIVARIERTPVTRSGRHMQVTLLVIGSPGHQIQLIWYRMPYIRNTLTHGKYFVFYGNVHIKDGKFVMEQPVVYTPEAYQEIENCFLPVYTLTSGITNNLMIKTMRQALDEEELLTDFLPGEIRTRRELCEYNYAVKQIHFPDTMERLIEARKRLVFDEFFLFIMGMQYQKEKRTRQENRFVMEHPEFVEDLIQKLPYELTGAQRRALHDVTENMQGPYAMQRLIQGDVGSGKTILAFLAMILTRPLQKLSQVSKQIADGDYSVRVPVHTEDEIGELSVSFNYMTEQLIEKMNMRGISPFHLALSGAGTAQQMFGLWIREYREKIKWEQLRFYWVDERCVSPDDEESNFKHADELLFRPLDIPHAHVHRIHGEREPEVEAEHYSELVKWELPGYASCPRFDAIILGIGEDGHTASIFPSTPELLTAK